MSAGLRVQAEPLLLASPATHPRRGELAASLSVLTEAGDARDEQLVELLTERLIRWSSP